MANVENIEKRLSDIIKTEDAFALALTGDWGIGKTYLWKKFRDKNRESFSGKKYAYVSLFGLDSLESLKLAIATEVQTDTASDSPLNVDISKHFKKLFGFVGGGSVGASGDMRFGINIGNKFITNIIMSHLKDTLVCLDDIERKSDSLAMSEIMGLVNYLKNERNCQVVMILHDEESEDQEYFNKHKEKVFDEILILDNSLSIIRNIIDDDELLPIYENFYKALKVKNLRFYQRVQGMFNAITNNLHNELSTTSKRQVLSALLIIRIANDMPSVFGKDIDFNFFINSFSPFRVNKLRNYRKQNAYKSDNQRLNDVEEIEEARNFEIMDTIISSFYSHFEISNWNKIIIEFLVNLDTDEKLVEKLSNSDKLNETQLKNDREKQNLLTEYYSLNPNENFNQRIFDNISHRISIDRENLNNLSFFCNILMQNGAYELFDQLQELIKAYIDYKVLESSDFWEEHQWYSSNIESYDIFNDYLTKIVEERKIEISNNQDIDTLSDIFKNFYMRGNRSEDLTCTILNISRKSLKTVIWQPLNDERDRTKYIVKLLQHPAFKIETAELINGDRVNRVVWHYKINSNYRNLSPFSYQPFLIESNLNEVKRWTLELLQERIVENPNSKAAIDHLLELTNNLENI